MPMLMAHFQKVRHCYAYANGALPESAPLLCQVVRVSWDRVRWPSRFFLTLLSLSIPSRRRPPPATPLRRPHSAAPSAAPSGDPSPPPLHARRPRAPAPSSRPPTTPRPLLPPRRSSPAASVFQVRGGPSS